MSDTTRSAPVPAGARRSGVLLVCPFQLLRAAIAGLLQDTKFEVTAAVASLDEAAEIARGSASVDLVLICACEADADEFQFIRTLRKARPAAHAVMLAMQFEADHLAQCLDAGIDGFLLVDLSVAAFHHSLELVAAGETVFPTRLAADIMNGGIARESGSVKTASVAGRERELLDCLVAGESNKGIARRFDLAETTIKMHLRQLYQRIGVTNRTQAAIWALSSAARDRAA